MRVEGNAVNAVATDGAKVVVLSDQGDKAATTIGAADDAGMDGCRAYERVATIDECVGVGGGRRASNDQTAVVYTVRTDGMRVQDLGTGAAGGAVEGKGRIGEGEAVAAIKPAGLGRGPIRC